MRRLLLLGLSLVLCIVSVQAQVGQGALKGTVSDESATGIPFANVALKQKGNLVSGTSTDFDGNFEIKPVPPGTYEVEISSLGFAPVQITNVRITSDKTTFLDKKDSRLKSSAVQLETFTKVENRVKLIEKDGAATSTTVTSDEIGRMAARSPAALAATVGGTYSKDDGTGDINVRGQRSDANYYYIDGIKVRGSSAIPQGSIEQISVITGGLPAQYGDVTGGVISITTKGVSRSYNGGFEYLTSGMQLSDNTYVGTDPFGYNLAEFSLSGPLFSLKDTLADGSQTKKPLLGFFISANYVNSLEPRPSAVGAWQVRDDVLADLKQNPLRQGLSGDQSVILNADYLRLSDFERVKVRPNTQSQSVNLSGKIDVATTSNTNLTFGGTLNYQRGQVYDYDHALFDSESHPDRLDLDWRAFARFTQRFNSATEAEEEKSASLIKNAYYSIQADYNRELTRIENNQHGDDFFKYGHIGTFETFQQRTFNPGQDSLTGIFGNVQTTFEDTLVTYVPGTANPDLARFTEQYYELNGWQGFDAEGNPIYDPDRKGAFESIDEIQAGGGLVNGDNLDSRGRSIYGMWVYNGDRTNTRGGRTDQYLESLQTQARLSAQGSADIGNHSFIVGFEYEQRVDRSYSLAPRQLWRIAELRANTHISDLDTRNPIIQYPGPVIQYDRLNTSPGDYDGANPNETQSFIDFNLRRATGLDPDGTAFLDIHSIDPEVYELEYFSTDELYNGGQSLVSYYGYDAYGNRTSDNPAFEDFFTERDEFGNLTRPIAPFQPIYVAGFIEDKFEFEDLIFRVGLRVDRYDANQQVLKDPYVLFPTIKAGDEASLDFLGEGLSSHPGNIGDDYVVYVDNVENPTTILGYRDGDVWYNATGSELPDAAALRVSNGLPAPLLVEENRELNNSVDITAESFEDYSPQTNFLPRIAFSFPISDEANFFAHYDVLTKRPTNGDRLDPSDYYFLESRASAAELNNPALQPERTIDYEVGFQQALNNDMALKISAFYRESRDLVQVVRVFDAYPIEYRTFDNIDFATVKGTTITYELRRTNNLSMRASYTLQFAEGTGSSSTSQLNLARSGEPNLRAPSRLSFDQRHQIVANMDYRYSSGSDYNGPIVGNAQILKNTGFNLQMRGGSGQPYNPQTNFTSSAQFTNNPNPLQQGAINSASLPWVFRFDLSVDRDFNYKFGENKRNVGINVYVQVLNLLNARNINQVYRATGNPDDDGYLNSALGVQNTEEQNSPSSFVEYYTLKLWNPVNWELPRRVRIGARVNF